MKTIAIMQPYLFPYFPYFQLIKSADIFVFYDDVQYIRNGWINRNRILLQGMPRYITLPVCNSSRATLIADLFYADRIEIVKNKILMTIRHAYSKAPYFESVYRTLKDIIKQNEPNVARFVEQTIRALVDMLEIEVQLFRSSEMKLNRSLKGQDHIIEIVHKLGGQRYINPISGIDLYSSKYFAQNDINLCFLQGKVQTYLQFTEKFIPDLSIIDVLMFNSNKQIQKMLTQFELKEKGPDQPLIT